MTDRDKRAIKLGLAVLIFVLVIGRGAPAARSWAETEHTRADSAIRQLARAKRLLRDRPMLARSLTAGRVRFSSVRQLLLVGDDATDASVSLSRAVRIAADSAGLSIATLQLETDTLTAGVGITHVHVMVDAAGDIREVMAFIVQLERQPLATSVRALSITNADAAATNSQPEILHLSVVVEGLALFHDDVLK